MTTLPALNNSTAIAAPSAELSVYAATAAADKALPLGERVERWLAGQASPATRRAIASDLRSFAAWAGVSGIGEAVSALINAADIDTRRNPTARMVEAYAVALLRDGKRRSTAQRHVGSLNMALAALDAADIGPGPQKIRLPKARKAEADEAQAADATCGAIKVTPARDMAGPQEHVVRAMLGTLAKGRTAKSQRDHALIAVLFHKALRRDEARRLNLDDLDIANTAAARIRVLGKGKTEAEWHALNKPAAEALLAWLAVRERIAAPGCSAVFVSTSGRTRGNRLTGKAIGEAVNAAGAEHDTTARAHGLRHASITAVADRAGLRLAQHHARHASPTTTARYDDGAKKAAKEAGELLAAII